MTTSQMLIFCASFSALALVLFAVLYDCAVVRGKDGHGYTVMLSCELARPQCRLP